MIVQVVALMWMRTTINYQHSKGTSTLEAMRELYSQGGLARFYQGWVAALLQAPLREDESTAKEVLRLLWMNSVSHRAEWKDDTGARLGLPRGYNPNLKS